MKEKRTLPLKFGDHTLKSQLKYLGVNLDCKLSFKDDWCRRRRKFYSNLKQANCHDKAVYLLVLKGYLLYGKAQVITFH